MPRIRRNFLSGTITNNPLLVGGTTLTSANLANLPAVTAPDTMVLALDPTGVNGTPEIVYVTAHTAAATSATITRGEEVALGGFAARQHASGTQWAHVESAASIELLNEAWTAYTPSVTGITVGNGTLTGKYQRVGRAIHYAVGFVLGSTSAIASNVGFSLPATPASPFDGADYPIGDGAYLDAGTAVYLGQAHYAGSATMVCRCWVTSGAYATFSGLLSTIPFTWTTSDAIYMKGTFEAAS